MKRLLGIVLLGVLVVSFAAGAFVTDAQAVAPKRCWLECSSSTPDEVECCMFVVPKLGMFIQCTPTGRFCR